MVLIWRRSWSAKSTFALAACWCLNSVSNAAQPLFFKVESTPYDNQMTRVAHVLALDGHQSKTGVSLRLVNHFIENLRSIPYYYSEQWRTPAEVKSVLVADCKGKAVALYATMLLNGANNVRLVIGKHHVSDQLTHAWLEWQTNNGDYVLDPTSSWAALKMADLNAGDYIPFYAYAGGQKYRAETAMVLRHPWGSSSIREIAAPASCR